MDAEQVPETQSANRLGGTLGLSLLVQIVLAAVILAQQFTWFLGGPVVVISKFRTTAIHLAWDPFFPVLAIFTAAVLGFCVVRARNEPLGRWACFVLFALTTLYWVLLLTFLSVDNWHSWLTWRTMPHPEQMSHTWFPSPIILHLTADPLAHALLWLGIVQSTSALLAMFQREYHPVRLWHILGIMFLVGFGMKWWWMVSAQYELSWP